MIIMNNIINIIIIMNWINSFSDPETARGARRAARAPKNRRALPELMGIFWKIGS